MSEVFRWKRFGFKDPRLLCGLDQLSAGLASNEQGIPPGSTSYIPTDRSANSEVISGQP